MDVIFVIHLHNLYLTSCLVSQRYIRDNYTRIKGVEKELANMQFELKLAAGPKRSALEMLRKKIEDQNEHVLKARSRYAAVVSVVVLVYILYWSELSLVKIV